jgi:hypothetical protein
MSIIQGIGNAYRNKKGSCSQADNEINSVGLLVVSCRSLSHANTF